MFLLIIAIYSEIVISNLCINFILDYMYIYYKEYLTIIKLFIRASISRYLYIKIAICLSNRKFIDDINAISGA